MNKKLAAISFGLMLSISAVYADTPSSPSATTTLGAQDAIGLRGELKPESIPATAVTGNTEIGSAKKTKGSGKKKFKFLADKQGSIVNLKQTTTTQVIVPKQQVIVATKTKVDNHLSFGRIIKTTVGTVVNAPMALARITAQETKNGITELIGESKNPILLAPIAALSLPFGITSALIQTPTTAMIDSWKHNGQQPGTSKVAGVEKNTK